MLGIIILLAAHLVNHTFMVKGHHLSAESISLTIQFSNSSVLTFDNLVGTTVFNVTKSVVEVETDFGGAYVVNIAGEHEDVSGSWEYWVNDVRPPIPANEYQLEDGDSVLWKQRVPDEPTPLGPLNSAHLFTIGATSILGIGYLIIIYLRSRWG
jgi:hypothetical protein